SSATVPTTGTFCARADAAPHTINMATNKHLTEVRTTVPPWEEPNGRQLAPPKRGAARRRARLKRGWAILARYSNPIGELSARIAASRRTYICLDRASAFFPADARALRQKSRFL